MFFRTNIRDFPLTYPSHLVYSPPTREDLDATRRTLFLVAGQPRLPLLSDPPPLPALPGNGRGGTFEAHWVNRPWIHSLIDVWRFYFFYFCICMDFCHIVLGRSLAVIEFFKN